MWDLDVDQARKEFGVTIEFVRVVAVGRLLDRYFEFGGCDCCEEDGDTLNRTVTFADGTKATFTDKGKIVETTVTGEGCTKQGIEMTATDVALETLTKGLHDRWLEDQDDDDY